MTDRRQESYSIRLEAAELARSRVHPQHLANGDEQRYADSKYFMSFTKGLPHNADTGLLHDEADFVAFRRAIDDGFIDPFSERVPHGARYEVKLEYGSFVAKPVVPPDNFRQWEAPTAGVVYELEGPDAQAVTMAPAPPLLTKTGEANPELVLEMAEVYELAILRDVEFNDFEGDGGSNDSAINQSVYRLNQLDYIQNQTGRPRKVNSTTKQLDAQTVFRGSSPGVEVGPYLSQFLLIGNADLNGGGSVDEGLITYGVVQIDQRVPIAKSGKDFMLTMDDYVSVQRGLAQDREPYIGKDGQVASAPDRPARRFISTPRDLATYVHYDALYEAYLNACLILLGMGTPFDSAFDHLSGGGVAAGNGKTRRNASGFALYGGPHILTLVTEVATRALKAVRFQKFNNHIRLRPEALAARIELVRRFGDLTDSAKAAVPVELKHAIGKFTEAMDNGTLDALFKLGEANKISEKGAELSYFLPMAFPEGSPMHPAYGAGHATVAGACVTILKAFFDTSAVLVKDGDGAVSFKRPGASDIPVAFRAPAVSDSGSHGCDSLDEFCPTKALTLEGELNKLAANISIGRDMAGVHYFTDYYDSARMGEEIAIGLLEEQALTYVTDPFVLSVPTFDGDIVRIGGR
ncbi:MAG: vanadium-dependent haloperoxidase [Cyanobacteria bacterium J06597_1]